jgi:hypothetical protein
MPLDDDDDDDDDDDNGESSVGIAEGYRLGGRGSIPGRAKRVFSLYGACTAPGAHPVSCLLDTGALFPRVV